MIAFTGLGVLVFWTLCFSLGKYLAWALDVDGPIATYARVVLGMWTCTVGVNHVAYRVELILNEKGLKA